MWRCERLLTIDSTQREMLRRLAADPQRQEGLGLWTTNQTSGIASHGRAWRDSPNGGGLAVSFAWPEDPLLPPEQAAWPVRISLMLLETLESRFDLLAGRLGLKWPNDVVCGDQKLAGILVSRHRVQERWWLVAGIGVNLGWDRPPEMDRPVTGLRNLGVHEVDPELLVQNLGVSLMALVRSDSIPTPWWDRYSQRDHWLGLQVSVVHPLTGETIAQGMHRGISAQGRLRLQIESVESEMAYGEVSLRKVESVS